jgi:hypothetical protein
MLAMRATLLVGLAGCVVMIFYLTSVALNYESVCESDDMGCIDDTAMMLGGTLGILIAVVSLIGIKVAQDYELIPVVFG